MTREEYNKCFLNGKKHIETGNDFGTKKDFGIAITFFVLGMEELIKYLVIKTATYNNSLFTADELHKIFSRHDQKHKLIIEFLESTKLNFGENFILSTFNQQFHQPISEELEKVQKNRFKEFGTMVGLTERHLSTEEIEDFIDWFKKEANSYKNKGLYVNQTNHTSLSHPNEVEGNIYLKVSKFAKSFLKQTEFSKNIDLDDDEINEILNSIN